MAFFAVMLPDALNKPDEFTTALKASFSGMDTETIKREQANMSRMGQLIRDAVVAVSIEKGKTPPPVTPTPAITGVVSGPRKFTSDQDVWNEWKAMEYYRKAKEEAPTGYSSKPTPKIIERASEDAAEKVITEFLTKRPDLSKEKEVMDVLNRALALLVFKDDPGRQKQQQNQGQQQGKKQQQQGKKKGGRHSTPRKSTRHSTYKRNMKH